MATNAGHGQGLRLERDYGERTDITLRDFGGTWGLRTSENFYSLSRGGMLRFTGGMMRSRFP